MKDTDIMHSIGAALQACAARVSTAQQPIVSKPATAPRERRAMSHTHLTARQLEVLALLCEGLPNKLICRQLNIAAGTVKVHISCIFRELGVASRLAAVVEAQRRGLVNPGNTAVETRRRDLLGRVMTGGSGPDSTAQAKQAAAAAVVAGSVAGRGGLHAAA